MKPEYPAGAALQGCVTIAALQHAAIACFVLPGARE
jgi:hypothetical protein